MDEIPESAVERIRVAHEVAQMLSKWEGVVLNRQVRLSSIVSLVKSLDDVVRVRFHDGPLSSCFVLDVMHAEEHINACRSRVGWFKLLFSPADARAEARRYAHGELPYLHDGFYAGVSYLTPLQALKESLARVEKYALLLSREFMAVNPENIAIVNRILADVGSRRSNDRVLDGMFSPIDLARSLSSEIDHRYAKYLPK